MNLLDSGFVQSVGRFVFGSQCLGCGVSGARLDPWLCPECKGQLQALSKLAQFPREDVFCLFPMRTLTRRLIHALKYKTVPGVASYLVRRSAAARGGQIDVDWSGFPRPLFFVPVPLHRARYRERGYNQAEKVAAALATVSGGKVCRWLKRKKFVVSQTKLSKGDRELNVTGAFEGNLPKNLPEVGTVILVDDVFTTGATTSSCLGALGQNFPLPVKVCTLLYEEPVTATVDFVADSSAEWDAR